MDPEDDPAAVTVDLERVAKTAPSTLVAPGAQPSASVPAIPLLPAAGHAWIEPDPPQEA